MSPLLVSGAGKGAGCFGMSAGCGGGVGMGGKVSMGDRVGLSSGGSIGVCVRNVFTEEEDGGVGEWY